MGRAASSHWDRQHSREESLDVVGWAGLGRAFNGWMYALRRRVFVKAVTAVLPVGPDTRVLDVGSGTGFYLDLWRALGAGHVEGSDMTENAAIRLRASHPGMPIHHCDIGGARGQLPTGPFDVVSAMDVLFHILERDSYEQAIANIAGLLRPGGHLVMSENLLDGFEHVASHQVSRSEGEIVGMLRAHGLEPIRREPMFVLMNGPVDSRNPVLKAWWSLLTRVVSLREWLGWIAGAAIFPIEVAALRIARRGPSTKLMICRRAGET
jgi:2-polyprenyl-3-methyl-5-hydroxy-6-metoxy-1,4-benzoquinol methylase